jgi:hypothetical protein
VSDLAEIYASMRTAINAASTQAAWAKQIGESPQIVNDVLNARRPPSPKILAALGYKKRIMYVRSNH